MPNIGVPELIIILVVALIIFGPKKLPELGRSLGKGINEFRSATREVKHQVTEGLLNEKENSDQAVS